MPEVIDDIKQGEIISAYIEAPFDEAQEVLESKGYNIISLAQNAQLRIQQGRDSDISLNGNWTREGILYTPKGRPRLVRNSPILYSPKEATQAHRERREFYPTRERIESALAASIDFPEKTIKIPTDGFGEEALTVFAFGGEENARAYEEFLRQAGINEMPVWTVDQSYVNSKNEPFVTQMWIGNLDDRSVLNGNGDLNGSVNRLRGIKEDKIGY
jgi:hypothetical protein